MPCYGHELHAHQHESLIHGNARKHVFEHQNTRIQY